MSRQLAHAQQPLGNFGPFFDDASLSDIVVKAGEAKIHAHKNVLSAHSSTFKAMFQVMVQDAIHAFCMLRMQL